MMRHVISRVFLGYGPHITCSNCNNVVWLEVWQRYQQFFPYLVPLPKQFLNFFVFCAICERGRVIKKKEKQEILELLEAGKAATKELYMKQKAKGKEELLEQLNRNGFTKLSAYLAFPEGGISSS